MIIAIVAVVVIAVGVWADWYFKRDAMRRHCKSYMQQEIRNWKK